MGNVRAAAFPPWGHATEPADTDDEGDFVSVERAMVERGEGTPGNFTAPDAVVRAPEHLFAPVTSTLFVLYRAGDRIAHRACRPAVDTRAGRRRPGHLARVRLPGPAANGCANGSGDRAAASTHSFRCVAASLLGGSTGWPRR